MRSLLLILSVLFAAHMCRGQSISAPVVVGNEPALERSGPRNVTPAELSTMMNASEVHVFDCNEEYMYGESHVPGSLLVEYDKVSMDKLPKDNDSIVVFYCYSRECPASHMAASSAMALGYSNVFYMLEGIIGWEDAGLPTEP